MVIGPEERLAKVSWPMSVLPPKGTGDIANQRRCAAKAVADPFAEGAAVEAPASSRWIGREVWIRRRGASLGLYTVGLCSVGCCGFW